MRGRYWGATMAKLHDPGDASGGGMAYVIMYWLARCIIIAIVGVVAIVAIRTTDLLDSIF
jgi:hypothetical protein